jgi:hypothetical protein
VTFSTASRRYAECGGRRRSAIRSLVIQGFANRFRSISLPNISEAGEHDIAALTHTEATNVAELSS